MACIHYRFSFQKDYKSIPLVGLQITVGNLKTEIMKREYLKPSRCNLKISSDLNEEYTDETQPLERFSCVIVRRVPVDARKTKMDFRHVAVPLFTKLSDLGGENASEEDKINAVIRQSSELYQFKPGFQRHFWRPAPRYVCRHCKKPDHDIHHCPLRLVRGQGEGGARKIRTGKGIPQSFMVKVEAGSKGAMLTTSGDYVMSTVDQEGYKHEKKEHPPFLPRPEPEPEVVVTDPEELTCVICKRLMADAAIVPCCGYSFCDDCIRTALLESEEHTCVACQQTVSPDTIVCNLALRLAVTNYENGTGYMQWKKKKTDGPKMKQKSPSHRYSPLHSSPQSRSHSRSPIRGPS